MCNKILIPDLNGNIAPCFEAATKFLLVDIKGGKSISHKKITCTGEGGFRRIRLIRLHDVDTLICSGIGGFYRDLLNNMHIELISDVSMKMDEAIEGYLDGRIKPDQNRRDNGRRLHHTALSDLVNWTRTFFERRGFMVSQGPGQDSFLIDLVAERLCPVCGKSIKIAVCCGAHTYRMDQEIREFHFCAKNDYNAKVYVCPENESAAERCREYNIEYMKYNPELQDEIKSQYSTAPILHFPISGHERLNVQRDI